MESMKNFVMDHAVAYANITWALIVVLVLLLTWVIYNWLVKREGLATHGGNVLHIGAGMSAGVGPETQVLSGPDHVIKGAGADEVTPDPFDDLSLKQQASCELRAIDTINGAEQGQYMMDQTAGHLVFPSCI